MDKPHIRGCCLQAGSSRLQSPKNPFWRMGQAKQTTIKGGRVRQNTNSVQLPHSLQPPRLQQLSNHAQPCKQGCGTRELVLCNELQEVLGCRTMKTSVSSGRIGGQPHRPYKLNVKALRGASRKAKELHDQFRVWLRRKCK